MQADGEDVGAGAAETAGGMDKFAGLMRLARVSGNTTVSSLCHSCPTYYLNQKMCLCSV